MTRDYKPAPAKPEKNSNPFLNGLIVGLLTGVAIAVAFTVYIKGGESPFTAKSNTNVTVESGDPVETKKAPTADAAPTKDRFEYYNILPGNESKVTEQEIKQGVLHRVRVGPFADPSQITKTKNDLVENGFKTDLIKVNTNSVQ